MMRRPISLLRRVRAHMRPGDQFLLGTDLRKDRATIEAAYNDSRRSDGGVQSQHASRAQRGAWRRLRSRALRAHRAFYNDGAHRIEMHLVRSVAQTVHIPGMRDARVRAKASRFERSSATSTIVPRSSRSPAPRDFDDRRTGSLDRRAAIRTLAPRAATRERRFSRARFEALRDGIRRRRASRPQAADRAALARKWSFSSSTSATDRPCACSTKRGDWFALLRPHAGRSGWLEPPGYGTRSDDSTCPAAGDDQLRARRTTRDQQRRRATGASIARRIAATRSLLRFAIGAGRSRACGSNRSGSIRTTTRATCRCSCPSIATSA